MNILSHLKSGAWRSVKAWRGIIIIWFLSLLLLSLMALPMKSGFKSLIGSSMITELLADNFNADVFIDLKAGLLSLLPALASGFLLVFLVTFLMNAFFTGGLFAILSSNNSRQTASHFFEAGASNFLSVLVIVLITDLIILVTALIIGGIPVAILSASGSPEPGVTRKVIRIAIIVFALILPLLILAADFARAWQVVNEKNKPYKAIGFGFSTTFGTFIKSYPVMVILMLIQSGFGALVMTKLLSAKPVTGGGVFLFFIGSQILFLIRIMLRAWRYGSVTSLMEDGINIKAFSQDRPVSTD